MNGVFEIFNIFEKNEGERKMDRDVAVAKINQYVADVRQRLQAERQEVTSDIKEKLREMHLEQERSQESHAALERLVNNTLDRINDMERVLRYGSAEGEQQMDERKLVQQVVVRIDAMYETIKECCEEQQLLKSALYHDRVVRDEMMEQLAMEDNATQKRILQAEETNRLLRNELHKMRSVCNTLIESADSLALLADESNGAKRHQDFTVEHGVVQEELMRLREHHVSLAGKIDSIEFFMNAEEKKRTLSMVQLEEAMADLERRVSPTKRSIAPASIMKKHLPVADTPPPREHRSATVRERLLEFYSSYNPERIESIDQILREYAGAERELFSALEIHYGALDYFTQRSR